MASCSGNKLPNGYGDEYEWKRSLPPGHGFYPTDQELITKYLKYRAQNLKIHPGIINDLDIYNHHPKELDGAYGLNEWDGRMYFFTAFKRKTKEGKRGDRVVGGGKGFWKASQAREKVKDDGGVVIGTKQPLVFHDGKGTKTSWLMSEFRYPENFNPLPLYNQTEHELALCVIYYHGERKIIGNNQESKSNNTNPMKRNIICNNQESKSNNTNPMKRNIICNNQESKSNNTNPMKRNIIGNNQEYKSNNTNPMKNLQSSHLIPTPCPNPNFTTTSNLQNPNRPPYPTLNPNFNATFAMQSPNHLPSPAQNSNFIATSSLYPTQNPNFSATFTMQNPNHPPSPTQNPNFIATTSSMQNPNHSLSFAQNPNFIVASSLRNPNHSLSSSQNSTFIATSSQQNFHHSQPSTQNLNSIATSSIQQNPNLPQCSLAQNSALPDAWNEFFPLFTAEDIHPAYLNNDSNEDVFQFHFLSYYSDNKDKSS